MHARQDGLKDPMQYYPVNLDVKNRNCLVVGGGRVGTRKVRTLLECGAQVTLISPEATPELEALAGQGRIQWRTRDYRASDLDDTFLVIGATDDQGLNRQIHQDAESAQRLCNIADQPDLCNFILPAVMRQGDLMITISTGGKSPAFAKHLRQRIEKEYGPEYSVLLQLMGAIRKRLLAEAHAPEAHKPLFEQLIGEGLLEMIRSDDRKNINDLLVRVLGPGFDYRALLQIP
jgi:precorrin-2 dehydrogenase/sirohydrochlorin ferrochelatase